MVVLIAIPQRLMADDITINETNFPDETFRNWVLSRSYGQDGVLTEEEIAGVTEIILESQGIKDLKGIEYFTALTELSSFDNPLKSLDVSKNTALTRLNCAYNQLTSLDVSNNTALTYLWCHNNQLTSLDLSKNTSLMYLWCLENHLTSLDLSKNTALAKLDCYGNKLKTLDLSKNTELTILNCGINQLVSLDVSMNTALTELCCHENQLTSLDLSKNKELTILWCFCNQINEKEMGKLVESLPPVSSGVFHALSPEDNSEKNVVSKAQVVAAKAKKWTVYVWDASIPDWVEYEGSDPVPEGIAIDETNFPDENFRSWVLAQDYGQDGVLTEAEIAGVTEIDVSSQSIADLTGIEYFTALTSLACYGNQLTSLDVSKNTALTELYCGTNQLTALDVSKNTALTELHCISNQLTALDVSKNTALTELNCVSNQLTALDVSKNTKLTELNCEKNQLTELDVSKNTTLMVLWCYSNQLTALDVSKNTALKSLHCSSNQLTALDVSKNTALTGLYCNGNQLTALDVSKNTKLMRLYCGSNQIKGAAMDALIAGLPSTGGEFCAIEPNDDSEQNVVTKPQVASAKKKGWTPLYWNNETYNWEEYEGSDPEIAPVDQGESIDIGNEIDASTDLDGNVVGDVFYSISSGDGSYDPTEGCIVVTKPTDESAIEGKDIFGEDFKAGFTGIVFKVAPGSGTVKVEAQTQGNMVLKVKIGDNAPVEMELEGKLKVKFPYSVSEETLVYIYGGTSAAGAKGIRKAAGSDALKIYGIEVTSETDGIKDIKDEKLKMKDSPVYNLNGQQVEGQPTQKGVYIKDGKKVLVK